MRKIIEISLLLAFAAFASWAVIEYIDWRLSEPIVKYYADGTPVACHIGATDVAASHPDCRRILAERHTVQYIPYPTLKMKWRAE